MRINREHLSVKVVNNRLDFIFLFPSLSFYFHFIFIFILFRIKHLSSLEPGLNINFIQCKYLWNYIVIILLKFSSVLDTYCFRHLSLYSLIKLIHIKLTEYGVWDRINLCYGRLSTYISDSREVDLVFPYFSSHFIFYFSFIFLFSIFRI